MSEGLVNATVPTEATRYFLKSVGGAWVDLKPLPYGQLIERRDKASRMSMEAGKGRNSDNARMDIDLMQAQSRLYEFQHCIVDHNLSDDQGSKLNFSMPSTLNLLNPKVGQEIEQLIDDMNQLEEVDEENFIPAPSSSTETIQDSQNEHTDEPT